MKNKRFARLVIRYLFVFCFAFLPLHYAVPGISIINFAGADEETYPGDIEQDATWGDEHAVVDCDVTVYEGITLTLQSGSHDFQGYVGVEHGANLILNEGEYIFEGGLSANGGNIIMKKGTYVLEGDFFLSDHSKLTIEKGSSIKFKKTGGFTPILQLTNSTIIAEGINEKMITFEAADENSDDFNVYIKGYDNNDISSFKYVNFIGGGQAWEGTPRALHNFFINAAYAAENLSGTATLDISNGNVSIEHAKFEKNNYYAINYAWQVDLNDSHKSLQVVDSDFLDNNYKLAVNSDMRCLYDDKSLCTTVVTLKNNYYNSADGPKAESNPSGTGNEVAGPVNLEGYNAQSNFISVVSDGPSNVLFLPGLEASRLYDNEERLWEPWNSGDVEALYLNKDGTSICNNIYTKEGDVLDETPTGANIYMSFIDKMDEMKYDEEINDWKAYAYDWRLSLEKILEDEKLEDALRNLAVNSKSGKVTIVAHSNGGLLTKALLKKIGDSETQNLVDKIIFVAVPQVGTPEAIGALLHGYDQRILPIFGTKTARGLAENMQGAYNLLPSEGYFSSVQTPVVMFDDINDESDMKGRYTENIDSKDELHDFLADDFRRVNATDADTDSPAELNDNLLGEAENLHDGGDGLDSWDAPEGVEIVQIAGWGVSSTLSQTVYGTHDKKVCDGDICQSGVNYLDPDFKFVIDGDGTVVTPSALWMNDGKRYWVDLGTYNKNNPFETLLGFLGMEHKNILEIPTLLSFIKDNINNSVKPISEYEYLSVTVPPSPSDKRLQYSLHSPLTLDMYAEVDGQALHTGINDQGVIEQQIPGTVFKQYGDKKYIFTDEDVSTSIVMKGYDEGTFTFSVEEFQGDDSQGKIEFKDLPTNSQTQVTFSLTNDLESASDLKIDKDGDGNADWKLEPKIGEIVTLDSIAPTTEANISGAEGKNSWYVGDVTLTFEAQDNKGGKGIEKTEYSMDNGNTWIAYADYVTFAQEGIIDVRYRSEDKQGNMEEVKMITIKIDKTAPEAKIFFDKDDKKLDITGLDNLSQNVVVTTEEKIIKNPKKQHYAWPWGWLWKNGNKKIVETAMLSDEAGHKTEVTLEKKKDKNGFIDAFVKSVSYDGQETKLGNNGLQYKWIPNWWRNKYLIFASHMKTESSILESHYLPKLDQTWIMEWPRELPDDEKDDIGRRPVRKKMPGMVIPGIITNKGNIKVTY